jgi:hypothetical protein
MKKKIMERFGKYRHIKYFLIIVGIAMGYNITKAHLKHTSFDGPMSVDRQQRNISTPQHEEHRKLGNRKQ